MKTADRLPLLLANFATAVWIDTDDAGPAELANVIVTHLETSDAQPHRH
ncbi:hypothetical protein AB0D49_38855 [Streptomyces sp. NPDC048290]